MSPAISYDVNGIVICTPRTVHGYDPLGQLNSFVIVNEASHLVKYKMAEKTSSFAHFVKEGTDHVAFVFVLK